MTFFLLGALLLLFAAAAFLTLCVGALDAPNPCPLCHREGCGGTLRECPGRWV